MKKNVFFVGMLAFAMVLGLAFTGCDKDGDNAKKGGTVTIKNSTGNEGSFVVVSEADGDKLFSLYEAYIADPTDEAAEAAFTAFMMEIGERAKDLLDGASASWSFGDDGTYYAGSMDFLYGQEVSLSGGNTETVEFKDE
jgi:hypothetical protein